MGNIFLSILGISASVSVVVTGLVLLTPFLNKRYAAKWKCMIWIFLALRLLVPFGGADGQNVSDGTLQRKMQAVSELEQSGADYFAATPVPYRRIVFKMPAQMTAPIKVLPENEKAGITMLDIAALVWISGSLIFMSVSLISYFHYKRQMAKKGRIIKEAHILSRVSQLKRELHISRTVCVMEYGKAASPMIIGFIKPVLVLPKEQYSCGDLFFILKHELVHLKRGDVYLKLLFAAANAVHWFNPFIWIMHKEAAIDMELSCDERVMQGTGFALRKAYTETLLSMLHKRYAGKTVLSTQFYGGTKIMKKRFENILMGNKKKNGVFMLLCAAALTIGLGMLAGCSAAKEDMQSLKSQNAESTNAEKLGGKKNPGEAVKTAAGTGRYLGTKDRQKIRAVLDAFAQAYFDGDADAVQKFLAGTYEGEIDTYEGTGTISGFTVKGLTEADEKDMKNGKCSVSMEFKDSSYEDMFLYLTVSLVKEKDDWKIQFFGVEG